MLHFNPESGLAAESAETVRAEVGKGWKAAFAGEGKPELDTGAETPAGQLIDSETAIITDKDAQVLYLANQFNPRTASGRWQDALGTIYFITRKTAEASVVTCSCTGLAGTVIPKGALVKSDDGLLLKSTAAATIPARSAGLAANGGSRVDILFSAQETGPLAISAGSVNQIVTTIPGWDTVYNAAAGSMGREVESQREVETRRYASVAKNAHGSVAAIYGETANIEGVLDLAILENMGNDPITKWGVSIPGHSIYASIYGGADEAIAEAIYTKKDAGCGTAGNTLVTHTATSEAGTPVYTYRIQRPVPLAVCIQVTYRITPTTPAEVEELVKRSLLRNFSGLDGSDRVKIASTLYASRFYCPILAAGVQDLVSIKICENAAAPLQQGVLSTGVWRDELSITADRVPVLSEEDIIFIKETLIYSV